MACQPTHSTPARFTTAGGQSCGMGGWCRVSPLALSTSATFGDLRGLGEPHNGLQLDWACRAIDADCRP